MPTARTHLIVGAGLLGVLACGGRGTSAGDAGQQGGASGSSSVSTGGSSSGSGGGSVSSTGGNSAGGASGSSTGGLGSSSTGGASASANLPADGNQLSVCTMQAGECNKGYGCYLGGGPGLGFCSKICTADGDCVGLAPGGAQYVCGAGAGTRVCTIPCQSSMDTSTCPSGMVCQQTGRDAASGGAKMAADAMIAAGRGGMIGAAGKDPAAGVAGQGKAGAGGDGAGGASAGTGGDGMGMTTKNTDAHCKYPLATSPLWGACDDGMHECGDMLTCAGQASSPSHVGYCTKTCTMDSDCEKPASGSITPTCLPAAAAGGRMTTKEAQLCALDCSSAMDGCPSGETCVKTSAADASQRCEYE